MIVGANKPWQYMEGDILLPWYTLTCLEWLTKQDVSKWNVFEFGAGYSTIWWRANCRKILSVESNPRWAKAVCACEFSENLPSAISTIEENWDCIIIDGISRFECLVNSINKVKQAGYIIIDNWGQEDFPNTKEAEELLVGWEKQFFKQPNHSRWITAVFRKP